MPAFDPAVIVLATLATSILLFATGVVRYDMVALLVVLVLTLTGTLTPEEAFRGFASNPVILIASMYVFGLAFTKTGVAEALGAKVLRSKSGSERSLVGRITLVSGLLSSVLSNTGVVATLIPVCHGLSRTYKISVSRLLMPMAFGSLLGGMVTVIATSTNVTVNEIVRRSGGTPFALFEFAPFGLIMVAAGALFFLGPGRALLPKRAMESLTDRYQVPKFVTEVLVEPSSTLINRAVADVDIFNRYRVTVLGIVRAGGEAAVLAPGAYNRIRADDVLLLQGAPDDLMALSGEVPLRPRKSVETNDASLVSDDVRLVEAVVAANSDFAGRTVAGSQFRTRTGLNVLALATHGEVQVKRMQNHVLEVGDTLLLQGHLADVERARRERQIIVVDEVDRDHLGSRGVTTIALLALVLCLAAFTSMSLSVLALAGAVALVISGVLRQEEAYRAVDWPVLVLVGGMLALGQAFKQHGLAEAVAAWLTQLGNDGLTPTALLALVLGATVGLTQVMNNVSTAAVMTPVALDLARATGYQSQPFLMAVMAGSSLAFLSPVAHQANAMIMGPGNYRYRDYLRVGLPLTAVMLGLAMLLIPWFWPLLPI
ncbi:MAG: di/tricarboxylate transporter [Planctomycetota bacterium]|jgi:di/tricarboxylate transporter